MPIIIIRTTKKFYYVGFILDQWPCIDFFNAAQPVLSNFTQEDINLK
jgi:hypothetical protein